MVQHKKTVSTVALLVLGLLIAAVSMAAEAVTFQADVDRRVIELGGSARLTLTATGVTAIEPITIPEIDGLKIQYLGPMTRVAVVNGQYSSSYSLVYQIMPLRTGEFEIPALALSVGGEEHTTEPIRVEARSVAGSEPGVSGPQSERLSDRIFVVMGTPKERVYLHERIPVTVKLLVNNLQVRDVSLPSIQTGNFILDEWAKPVQYEQVINGVRYQILEFKTSAYATRVGHETLGPVSQTCQLIVKDDRRSRRGGFFDDDFFDGLFSNYSTQAVTLAAEPLALEVVDVPRAAAPAGFSGAVGSFVFEMTVSPREVAVGDPVTVRMTLGGDGNLAAAEFPVLTENDDFKVYAPQVRVEGDKKILEQVVVPRHAGVTEYPAVGFVYFDPATGRFETHTAGPFPLTVRPAPEGVVADLAVRTGTQIPAAEDAVGADIAFIHGSLGRLITRHDRAGAVAGRLGVALAVLGLLWLAGCCLYWFSSRLSQDERLARQLKAPRYARHGLRKAERFLTAQEWPGFYDAVHETLQMYFGHKCHLPAGNVTAPEVARSLSAHGLEASLIDRVRNLFDECEAARYAHIVPDRDAARGLWELLRGAIDQVERKY